MKTGGRADGRTVAVIGVLCALSAAGPSDRLTAQTPDSIEALYRRGQPRDWRRIVVEHANSPWADDALFALSQRAFSSGNPAGAMDYALRLRSDYPGSELAPRAALWGARAAFDVGEPRSACALLDSAATEAASDVEFVNQIQFYRGRCTAAALTAPPRAARDSMMRPLPPTPYPGFEVQAAAARTDSAAQDIIGRLQRAGLTARVVPGPAGVLRIRLGPFATSETADSVARAAGRHLGGTPFIERVP